MYTVLNHVGPFWVQDLDNLGMHDFWIFLKTFTCLCSNTFSISGCGHHTFPYWVLRPDEVCQLSNCMFDNLNQHLSYKFELALFDSVLLFLLLSNKFNFKLTEFISALTQQTIPGLFLRQIMTTGNRHWSLTTEGLLWVNRLFLRGISYAMQA